MTKSKGGWYIIDLFAKKYYGPYTSKKVAKLSSKHIKVIADFCVEIGTNVGVVDYLTFLNEYRDFEEGKILNVIESNRKFKKI